MANPKEYKAKYMAANLNTRAKRAHWYKDNCDRLKEYSHKYYIHNPDKMKQKRHRRLALEAGVKHEPYKDLYIFERDGWICGICGQKINRQLKHPNPRSKSIDHIISLAMGGIDAPINLQPAHLRCNQNKSTKNGGQLRLMG